MNFEGQCVQSVITQSLKSQSNSGEKMMKVGIFTTEDLTGLNAHALYIKESIKHLVKFEDLEIHLIAPNDIPDELKKGLKYVRYWQHEKPVLRFFSAFSAIPKLLREDYDIYHSFWEKATGIALIAQRIKRKKIPILHVGSSGMVRAVDMEIKIKGKSVKREIIRYLLKFRANIIHKHSHALMVYSEALREYLIKNNIYKKKIFAIPIGINLELFGREYEKDLTLINKLGLKKKKVIMYTGRITVYHGVLYLIKAMEIINMRIKDVVLVIVGDGDLLPTLKDYIKKKQLRNIIFTGEVPHEEFPRYHGMADVLVIPHMKFIIDSELQIPTKLLEYLASGKPIVSPNFKAIAEVVGDNAILVEPEKPQAFADGILTLLNDEDLAKKIGENGKKIIYNYSWEENAKKIYEAYKYLLSSKY